MIAEALHLLKNRKMMLQGAAFFAFFMIIYTMIDGFNLSYAAMSELYGSYLVLVNIFLNVLMAGLSAFLLNLSTAMAALKGKESKGSNLSFLSVLFGILTYGCTPCVIAFFASIGIAFSVIALPLAGLPYKFISLLLIVIGILWTLREIKVGQCKVNYSK
jgi:hypothetical protein